MSRPYVNVEKEFLKLDTLSRVILHHVYLDIPFACCQFLFWRNTGWQQQEEEGTDETLYYIESYMYVIWVASLLAHVIWVLFYRTCSELWLL